MNELQQHSEQLQASFERAMAEAERREIQGREWAAKTMDLGLQETGAPGTVLKDGKLMQKADAEAELARDKTIAQKQEVIEEYFEGVVHNNDGGTKSSLYTTPDGQPTHTPAEWAKQYDGKTWNEIAKEAGQDVFFEGTIFEIRLNKGPVDDWRYVMQGRVEREKLKVVGVSIQAVHIGIISLEKELITMLIFPKLIGQCYPQKIFLEALVQ